RAVQKFSQNPGATALPLSSMYTSSSVPRAYHEQNIASREGQSASYAVNAPLDGVTAAFGAFNFYLVPIGLMEKLTPATFRITVNYVAVHIIDSFDFNGWQPLGYWMEPNWVDWIWFSGSTYVSNEKFRYYRGEKARGGDYTAFTTPKLVTLQTPVVYTVS